MDDAESLNQAVFFALRGGYSKVDGEMAIAALLRSGHEIDPIVREELAQAICPVGKRPTAVRLELTKLEEGARWRKLETSRNVVELGLMAMESHPDLTDRKAADSFAGNRSDCSTETVRTAIRKAKKYLAWCQKCPPGKMVDAAYYNLWCETFHHAEVEQIAPDAMIEKRERLFESLDEEAKRIMAG